MNAPLAKQAALRETTGPNDLPDYMQLCHMMCFILWKYKDCSIRSISGDNNIPSYQFIRYNHVS